MLGKLLLVQILACFLSTIKAKENASRKVNPIIPCVYVFNSSIASTGEFVSPNYPNLYPHNVNCR